MQQENSKSSITFFMQFFFFDRRHNDVSLSTKMRSGVSQYQSDLKSSQDMIGGCFSMHVKEEKWLLQ